MNSSTGNGSRSTVRKTNSLWDPCVKLIRSRFLNSDIHLDPLMGNMFLSISLLEMIRLLKKINLPGGQRHGQKSKRRTDIRKRMSVPFRYDPKDVYRTFRQMSNERNLSDTRISGTTRRRWKTKKMQERHQSDFQFSQRVFFAKGASCADSCRIAVVISPTKDIISVLSDRS